MHPYAFIINAFPKVKRFFICLDLTSIKSFDEILEYPFEFSN